ncbi:MAG TPA: glycosyl transferase family 2 [Flavobacteriaceae bacterium]|nr:glycosyl transferase family 2 [Flavobacteriaceae bacterium]
MILSWSLLLIALGAALIHAFFIARMRSVTKSSAVYPEADFSQPGISVIVCAKNEAERLDVLIPQILNQNYPCFELLIVDDHSSDRTQQVLTYWKKIDSRVQCVKFDRKNEAVQGKKAALSYGINRAKYELLLLTDADCTPGSEHWISAMTTPFVYGKSIVLGYGAYLKQPGILNALIRFETSLTAGLYLGQALSGRPYMGVGRNLAYRKDFFYTQNGFKSHEHIPSGDDDLLINHGANAVDTAVVIEPKAFTWSAPKESWWSLVRQKRRHQSTAHYYRKSTKLMLGLYSGSLMLFYTCVVTLGILLAWNSAIFQAVLVLLFLRSAYLIGQMASLFRRLQTADLLPWIPLLEPLLICLQLFIFVWNRFSKPIHWN